MTETTAAETDLSLSARLARTRLAVRAAMIVERGWPLVLPLLVVVSLFLSLSWLGVFRILPDMVRLAAVAALGLAALGRALPAALLSPPFGRRDRPPHRARQQARPHARAGADRPAERQGQRLRRGAVARAPAAHGGEPRRRRRRPAAHPRPRARPLGPARRGGASAGDRFRLLLRAAGRQGRRRLPGAWLDGGACRRASTPG